jgi:hypothetical protein
MVFPCTIWVVAAVLSAMFSSTLSILFGHNLSIFFLCNCSLAVCVLLVDMLAVFFFSSL